MARNRSGDDERHSTGKSKSRRWGRGDRADKSGGPGRPGDEVGEDFGWLDDLRSAKEEQADIGPGDDVPASPPPVRRRPTPPLPPDEPSAPAQPAPKPARRDASAKSSAPASPPPEPSPRRSRHTADDPVVSGPALGDGARRPARSGPPPAKPAGRASGPPVRPADSGAEPPPVGRQPRSPAGPRSGGPIPERNRRRRGEAARSRFDSGGSAAGEPGPRRPTSGPPASPVRDTPVPRTGNPPAVPRPGSGPPTADQTDGPPPRRAAPPPGADRRRQPAPSARPGPAGSPTARREAPTQPPSARRSGRHAAGSPLPPPATSTEAQSGARPRSPAEPTPRAGGRPTSGPPRPAPLRPDPGAPTPGPPGPPAQQGTFRTARSELRRQMREQQRVRTIALVVIVVLALVAPALYFGILSAARDPVLNSLDRLPVADRYAGSSEDRIIGGSRWCFINCRFRERRLVSEADTAETTVAYQAALREVGWTRWDVDGCPQVEVDGEYSCWRRDEYTLDLWVHPPECAYDPLNLRPDLDDEEGEEADEDAEPTGSEECSGSVVEIKMQNRIGDERGQLRLPPPDDIPAGDQPTPTGAPSPDTSPEPSP